MKLMKIALVGGLMLSAGAIALPDAAQAQRGGYYYDQYQRGYSPYYGYSRDYRPRYRDDYYGYGRRDRRSYNDYRPQKRRQKYKQPHYKQQYVAPNPSNHHQQSRDDQGGE